ncbi:MAG: protein-tyrosine phosphatase [Gaiellaceae bacterium]|nr:protein-tyrosine phosphatase [Gaiellaceae bacterium]
MIDTHCHLLPALDDGPGNRAESLALASALSRAGVTAILCTPHFSRRYPTLHELARERLVQARKELAAAEIPLELRLAAEIAPALLLGAGDDEIAARRSGPFILVELEPDTPRGFVEQALVRCSGLDLVPVFAHPERCAAVRRDPGVLDEARAGGALTQSVASSLAGRWGHEVEASAWSFLGTGRIDIVASDAHRVGRRGLALVDALAGLQRRFGAEAVRLLTEQAPGRIFDAATA